MLHDEQTRLAGSARISESSESSKRRRPSRNTSQAKPTSESVLKSFNTWSFKREQPTNPDLMRRFVADAMVNERPISFVLYWGKGPRRHAAAPDLQCLDYLTELAKRVASAYERGAAITIIFTDTHARLNGHSEESAKCYFHEVELAARKRGLSTCRLGELTSSEVSLGGDSESTIPSEILKLLTSSAAKWYGGKGSAEDGARRYYQINMIEKRAVERVFPDSIFVTFNGSDLRCLFPEKLPIFYMHSLRRGVSVKPWFIP